MARLLALQRSAGNHAVSRMLQRYPKAPKVGIMDAKLVPPTAGPFEGAVSTDTYDRQPAALRRVLDASHSDGELFWLTLDREERAAIVTIYNRFQRFGLWQHTKRIRGVKKGTPSWCGFWVQGDTPSVELDGNADKLLDQLTTHPRFCFDAGIGGSLHAGQHSFREISDSDSLHVSVGQIQKGHGGFQPSARGFFDAHVDRYASPSGKSGFACEYHVGRTGSHIGTEVVPGMVNKKLKGFPWIGGVEIFPHDRPGPRPELFEGREERERDMPTPPMIGIKGRFRMPWGL